MSNYARSIPSSPKTDPIILYDLTFYHVKSLALIVHPWDRTKYRVQSNWWDAVLERYGVVRDDITQPPTMEWLVYLMSELLKTDMTRCSKLMERYNALEEAACEHPF